jgi:hypothetical protein
MTTYPIKNLNFLGLQRNLTKYSTLYTDNEFRSRLLTLDVTGALKLTIRESNTGIMLRSVDYKAHGLL